MKRFLAGGTAALLLAGAAVFNVALPAAATGPGDQVCSGLDSGKIDTTGDPQSVVLKAPEGQVIVRYCVKAGSAQQGDGPVYVTVDAPANQLTITHPSGKAISHYSFEYAPKPVEPVVIVPTVPTPVDECGTANDKINVPDSTDKYFYSAPVYADRKGSVTVTAKDGYVFEGGKTQLNYDFTFTNVPCEVPPTVVTPTVPTKVDECGTANDKIVVPADTDKYTYGAPVIKDGKGSVTVTAKDGYVFEGGKTTLTFEFTFTNVPCEVPPTVVKPTVPTKVDECGTANDKIVVPADTDKYTYGTPVIKDGEGSVTVTAKDGYVFEGGKTTLTYDFTFTNEACEVPPTVIAQHPLAPVFLDKCGTADDEVILPEDTDEFYYQADLEDGMAVVTVIARDGYVFGDEAVTSWAHTFTDEPCTVQTVVTPPAPQVTVTPQAAPAPQVKAVDRSVEREVLAYTGADDAATTRDAAIGGSLLLLGVLALGFARLRRQHR
ncbi:hypothetical protein [Desertivibrio insolitus]|uniref:hypothetical protein n=1 Tax=Herbiconiux sp. SYSU D00978 TaxID=2812562 RepID=UPI001A978247|nr:hypothetical protein [Herbiconiux sp. SYSU D00978]